MAFKPAFQDVGGGGGGGEGGLTPAQEAKLDSLQFGATANQTNTYLLNRENHTGTQGMATVDGLDATLGTKVDKVAGKGLSDSNYTQAEKDKLNGVADEATKNQTDAYLLARENHTGTQGMETVDGLDATLDTKVDKVDGFGLSANDFTNGLLTKLNNIQDEATKNETDGYLLDRANHAGTQPISTVDGLDATLGTKVDKVAGKGLSDTNYTQAEKDKLNGVADEATKNLPDATLLARENHTGTQPINTVAGLQAALDAAAESGGISAEDLARLVAVENTLPNKADLEGGKLALSQMPDIAAGRKSTVADEAARLTLDVWPDLTIAYQMDDGNAYALDANDDPSVPANWSMLGSGIADGVGSFNSRTGNVLPQAGDYTAEQITESAAKQFVSAAEKAEWTATVPVTKGDVGLGNVDNVQQAPITRTITAGTGLTGGGNLTADRTLSVNYGTSADTAAQG